MANCLGDQYGGGIQRYVPKLELLIPSLQLQDEKADAKKGKVTEARCTNGEYIFFWPPHIYFSDY